jgi:hypothetical protein
MENRIDRRRRVLRAGTIEFAGGAIDCTVRNLSDTGAMLEVESPVGIPSQFTLTLADGHHTPCEIMWRKPKRIGVAFK